jgi:hypothetical protein
MTTRRIVAALAALALLGASTARAEIWIVIENPNSAKQQDYFEVYDRVCDITLPAVVIRGHGAANLSICGGISAPGSIRIRVSGESAWTDVVGLHSWSVVEAPRRPMTLRRKAPLMDDDE